MNVRNREIDWLRAYAVLPVIATHGALIMPGANAWDHIANFWFAGSSGVDLFFVISGLVISASFLPGFDRSLAESDQATIVSAARFYKKRFRRLYPALGLWASVILFGSFFLNHDNIWLDRHTAFVKFVGNLLYVSNFSDSESNTCFGYFWSLAVEMQFYLLFPLFLYLVRQPRWRLTYLSGLFIVFAFWLPGGAMGWQFRFSGIIAGIILFYLSRSDAMALLRPTSLAKPWRARAFTTIALFFLLTSQLSLRNYYPMAMTISVIVSALLVWAASYQANYIATFGLAGVLDWVGARSYSLYLCHIPVAMLNRAVWSKILRLSGQTLSLDHAVPLFATWLVALVVLAEISYRLFEKPFYSKGGASLGTHPAPSSASPACPLTTP